MRGKSILVTLLAAAFASGCATSGYLLSTKNPLCLEDTGGKTRQNLSPQALYQCAESFLLRSQFSCELGQYCEADESLEKAQRNLAAIPEDQRPKGYDNLADQIGAYTSLRRKDCPGQQLEDRFDIHREVAPPQTQ